MKKILIISLCLLVFLVASSYAMSANEQMQGYALNNTHSVADPEKPGFTRDTWHLIINIMHKNGMEKLSDEDKGALVDYFYMIRKGLERSAG
jgi:uncharacterized membrane protein